MSRYRISGPPPACRLILNAKANQNCSIIFFCLVIPTETERGS
jgi:hypothetical protein